MLGATSTYTHAAAVLGYLAFAAVLALRSARSWISLTLFVAAAATAVWAAVSLLANFDEATGWLVRLSETVRDGSWFTVVLAILYRDRTTGHAWLRLALIAAAILLCDAAFATGLMPGFRLFGVTADAAMVRIAVACTGLVLIENLLRNATRDELWSIKFIGIGLIGIWTFELMTRLPEFLTHQPAFDLLAARPLIYLLMVPLFTVTAIRLPAFHLRIHSSRSVVVYTATLICIGVILQGTALASLYIRMFGGTNATVISVVLIFAVLCTIAVALASASLRARIRLFVSENFFNYKYDYRMEWERFIRALTVRDDGSPAMRTLRTLADLFDCSSGILWVLRDGGRRFVPAANWSDLTDVASMLPQDDLVRDLTPIETVFLDVTSTDGQPAVQTWRRRFPAGWLVIPLRYRGEIAGVALLQEPRVRRRIEWEDRKLIELVALQLGAYLAQEETAQALADARALEAFNKRSAFLIHDIKNMIGQLSLMMKNAERFGDDPEFQKDSLATVGDAVARLNDMMSRLIDAPAAEEPGVQPVTTFDLAAFLQEFVAAKRQLGLDIGVTVPAGIPAAGIGDETALLQVLEHVVGNAVEAAPSGSRVEIGTLKINGSVAITVEDRGPGMSEDFVSHELFRPLRTTKSRGFGIGAFQARETMRNLGGDVEVKSRVGEGTMVILTLPPGRPIEGVATP